MFKYSINLAWSDEDDCYIATIPELPGLSAFGDTPEEAAEEAKIAAEGFIEVYKKDGCKLPDPEKFSTYSGQIRVRMPKSLHSKLAQEAKREEVSLNQYMVHLLSERNIQNSIDKKLAVIREQKVDIIVLEKDTPTRIESGNHIQFFNTLINDETKQIH
jgi:predicted RNase H-like HicB family nuclease